MGRAVFALLALSACGRIDFARLALPPDAPDVPVGHDEDGDGIPDTIDPCPHVAGDLTDSDGDGVGDACDPNPTTPSEHYVLFATMQAGDAGFTDAPGAIQEADSVRFTQDTSATIAGAIGTARIDIGFDIHGLVGTAQHQIASGIGGGTTGVYYFTELNNNVGPMRDAAIVSYDATNGYILLDQVDPGDIHAGTGYLRYDAIATAPAAWHLETGWIGQLYDANAATPSYAGGTSIACTFNGLDVSIRYIAVIATQ